MKTNYINPRNVGLAVLLIAAAQAHALPFINGAISFTGGAVLNGPLATATAFTAFEGAAPGSSPLVLAGSQTGDFSSVTGGTSATFEPFTFSPPPGSPDPLWTFTSGGTTYSFDITSVNIGTQSPLFLNLFGTGTAHITGFADTTGTWSITDTSLGATPTITFGSDVSVAAAPEPSSTAEALLGLGSFGFARLFRRKK